MCVGYGCECEREGIDPRKERSSPHTWVPHRFGVYTERLNFSLCLCPSKPVKSPSPYRLTLLPVSVSVQTHQPPPPPSLNSWGYNTAEERAAAKAQPGIELLPTEGDFLAYIKQRQQQQQQQEEGGGGGGKNGGGTASK